MSSYVYGIICNTCRDTVWSRHRHDMRDCRCGQCYIDGGRDYTRVGWYTLRPISVRMRLGDNGELEFIQLIREYDE